MKNCFIICLGLSLALMRCDSASVEDQLGEPSVVVFENLDGAEGFVQVTPGTEVIHDEAAWTALWEATWSITNGDGIKTAPPAVDFGRKMVIGVFWGDGFSGCSNGVEAIETIVQREDEIVVVVGPLPDLGLCDALVYPVQMVQMDRSGLPVMFEGTVPGQSGTSS